MIFPGGLDEKGEGTRRAFDSSSRHRHRRPAGVRLQVGHAARQPQLSVQQQLGLGRRTAVVAERDLGEAVAAPRKNHLRRRQPVQQRVAAVRLQAALAQLQSRLRLAQRNRDISIGRSPLRAKHLANKLSIGQLLAECFRMYSIRVFFFDSNKSPQAHSVSDRRIKLSTTLYY